MLLVIPVCVCLCVHACASLEISRLDDDMNKKYTVKSNQILCFAAWSPRWLRWLPCKKETDLPLDLSLYLCIWYSSAFYLCLLYYFTYFFGIFSCFVIINYSKWIRIGNILLVRIKLHTHSWLCGHKFKLFFWKVKPIFPNW